MRALDRRLASYARSTQHVLIVDVLAGAARTVLLLVQVVVFATAASNLVEDGVAVPTSTVVLLAALVAVRALLGQVVERYGRDAAVRVQSQLRRELVARRFRHGGTDLDDVEATSLAVAAVQGVDGLEVYFGRYVPQLALAVVVPVVVLVWVATIDVLSALIMLVTIPLIPLFMWLIGRFTQRRAMENHRALATMANHFLDLVRGLPTLRAFNRGQEQVPRLRETSDQYRRTTMRTLRIAFLSGTVLDLATSLSIAMVAVTLGVRLVGGGLDLRPALTVLLLVPEFYAPVRAVATLFHASADGLGAADRILDVLDRPERRPSTRRPRAAAETGSAAAPLLDVRAASITFPGRDRPTLEGVDLVIDDGEMVAVMGPSGAGKTTLGRMALGLLAPDSGEVCTRGHPVADDLDAWRGSVAWSAQRPALVRATVFDNIALGLGHAAPVDVRAAARAAAADSFIEELPLGYDTLVGDGARRLSAGQRQRIGLARALLRDAALTVLDEPTAHLDRVTATAIIQTLATRPRRRAMLVLTHDDQLAAIADRVVEIDVGRLGPRGARVQAHQP